MQLNIQILIVTEIYGLLWLGLKGLWVMLIPIKN